MTLADLRLRPDEVRALYLVHLQQVYSGEQQLMNALPGLAIHISSTEVRKKLLVNATQTPQHIGMIETIYTQLSAVPEGPICTPMKALVDQSMEVTLRHPFGPVRDVLLIATAKAMKHLGIAKYSMGVTFAKALEYKDQVAALSQARQDEVEIDRDLTFFVENLRLISHNL